MIGDAGFEGVDGYGVYVGQVPAHPVETDDLARLSPYIRKHINVQGHYTFRPADTSNRRPLRDPNTIDETDLVQG